MAFKKIIFGILLAMLVLGIHLQAGITLAQENQADHTSQSGQPADQTPGQTSEQTKAEVDGIFHLYTGNNASGKNSYVQKLPGGDWQSILTAAIKFMLGISGTLAFISFTVAGVLFVTARGEEDQLTKAKHMLLWSIAALAIIAVSYAIVLGISQFKYFS